jgi:hypothetical protein
LCPRTTGIRLNGLWYCSSQCFEGALVRIFSSAQATIVPGVPAGHRMPLGLLLLSRGHVTDSQLRVALEVQSSGGRGRIGECLLELGFVTELQVTAALGAQWACPVFPGQRVNSSTCDGMLPLPLLENFRMLPVQFVAATRILYIAFGAEVNYGVLYAIERMLGCRTEACVISDRCLRDALECLAQERRTGDRLFEGWGDAREMARLTSGYALKFAAPTVRIMGCGEYIWVRLESGSDFANLLFRQSAPSAKVQQLLRA